MVLTPSTMAPLGTQAPPFALPDIDGRIVRLDDFADAPALLVLFLCNHCPYVKHIRGKLAEWAAEQQRKGLAIVGINANDFRDPKYAGDGPDHMKREVAEVGYTFPYLVDETQEVAKAYTAACTPDFFLYDRQRRLVYRGQFDDSRPESKIPVTGQDLERAVDAVLAGRPVDERQKPSMGCNIKWKPGNEPPYFG